MRPNDRKYLKSHEWAKIDGDTALIGITDFAVSQLNEPTYLDIPTAGDTITAGETLGEIESVKAVSDLYSPVTGEVLEVNDAIVDNPSTLTEDAFEGGWMLKVKISEASSDLMDAAAYESLVESEA